MENLSWNVWFFFMAQLLHGAGAAPLFTLGVTFIDENVTKKMSSVYLGECLTFFILDLFFFFLYAFTVL
jgi:Organic Anion Transporter Polypeptide (OATP) family